MERRGYHAGAMRLYMGFGCWCVVILRGGIGGTGASLSDMKKKAMYFRCVVVALREGQ